MKKLLLIFTALILTGCSVEKPSDSLDLTLVPIQEVKMADTFVRGRSYTIELIYKKPTRCHTYSSVSYESVGNQYDFGVVNSFNPNDSHCTEEGRLTDNVSFTFDAERNDFYIFNFWQGLDENKNPVYLTKQIPISKT